MRNRLSAAEHERFTRLTVDGWRRVGLSDDRCERERRYQLVRDTAIASKRLLEDLTLAEMVAAIRSAGGEIGRRRGSRAPLYNSRSAIGKIIAHEHGLVAARQDDHDHGEPDPRWQPGEIEFYPVVMPVDKIHDWLLKHRRDWLPDLVRAWTEAGFRGTLREDWTQAIADCEKPTTGFRAWLAKLFRFSRRASTGALRS